MEALPDFQTLVWWIAAIAFAAPLFAGALAIFFHVIGRERSRCFKHQVAIPLQGENSHGLHELGRRPDPSG
jgi:hypothetical protein